MYIRYVSRTTAIFTMEIPLQIILLLAHYESHLADNILQFLFMYIKIS